MKCLSISDRHPVRRDKEAAVSLPTSSPAAGYTIHRRRKRERVAEKLVSQTRQSLDEKREIWSGFGVASSCVFAVLLLRQHLKR